MRAVLLGKITSHGIESCHILCAFVRVFNLLYDVHGAYNIYNCSNIASLRTAVHIRKMNGNKKIQQ